MTLETGVKELAEAVGADVKALANGKVDSSDPRLTDAREWSAATVTQAEAEVGIASTRRAWTSQRVRQAINAWWQLVTSGFGRNLVSASNEASARDVLQLGSAATRDVGTSAGNVLEVGAGGWLGQGGVSTTPLGYPASIVDATNSTKTIRSEAFDNGVRAYSSGIHFSNLDTWGRLRVSYLDPRAWIQGGSATAGTGWTAELYHSANMLNIGKTAATARTALELGYAATALTVGGGAEVMRAGAYGLGEQSIATLPATQLGWNAFFNANVVAINSSGPFTSYLGIGQNTAHIINNDGDNIILTAELHHTSNILATTGQSTEYPMTQKAVTDALNTKANTSTQVIAGTGLSGGGNLSANRTLSVNYGTTAGTSAQGNDSRIVNSVQTSGDQTIEGIKTFSSFPVMPSAAPTDDYQAANKKYVDDRVSGTGWNVAGSITLNGTTDNTVVMSDIVTELDLEIGDAVRIEAGVYNKLHTVESITDNSSIIVNYEHAGNRADGSLKLPDFTGQATVTRIAKWFNAPLGLGQAWVDMTSFRVVNVAYFPPYRRSICFSAAASDNGAGYLAMKVGGVAIGWVDLSANTPTVTAQLHATVSDNQEYEIERSSGSGLIKSCGELR